MRMMMVRLRKHTGLLLVFVSLLTAAAVSMQNEGTLTCTAMCATLVQMGHVSHNAPVHVYLCSNLH